MPHQMVANNSLEDVATHYKVLDIPWNLGANTDLSAQYLRTAYRRALFQHHPDKSRLQSEFKQGKEAQNKPTKKATYTIDQITDAYNTLSLPKLRFEYDRSLKLQAGHSRRAGNGDDQTFRSGLEIVDLDDLDYDEISHVWFRSCRCGDGQGFQLGEADLQEASDIGELHIGCRGCSLWLKILFGVVEGESEAHVTERGLEEVPTLKDIG